MNANSTVENGSIDWSKVDWDKSNYELCTELFGPYVSNFPKKSGLISHYRKKFGHPKIGTFRTRTIDWKALDWSKSNNELARQINFSANVIRDYRARLGNPPSYARGGNRPRCVITDEMINAADWANVRDNQLARSWGVSRERVRQIRLERRMPAFCGVTSQMKEMQEAVLWLNEHADQLNGKYMVEIAREMPGDRNYTWKRRALHASKVKYRRGGPYAFSTKTAMAANWELPNRVLVSIWGWNPKCVGSIRGRYSNKSPKWSLYGHYEGLHSEEFKKAIDDEIKKARSYDIEVDEEKVYGLLASIETWAKNRSANAWKTKHYKVRLIHKLKLEIKSLPYDSEYCRGMRAALELARGA